MRPPDVQRERGHGLSATITDEEIGARERLARPNCQILDADGDRLPRESSAPLFGAPPRATPGWYAWAAADGWAKPVR